MLEITAKLYLPRKDKITDMVNVEKYIATKNNQMSKFKKKRWNSFIKNQAT